jgi:hypothetical protein
MTVPVNAQILDTFSANTVPKYSNSIEGNPVLKPSLITDDGTTLRYNGNPVSGSGASGITGSGTAGFIPKFDTGSDILDSHIDDGLTTAGVVTSSEPVAVPYLLPQTIYSAAGTPLPAATTALKGAIAIVSDATTPTFLGAYVSGGTVLSPVMCTGSGWVTC